MLLEVTVSTKRTIDEAALIMGRKFCRLEETAGGKKTTSRFFETSNIPKTSRKNKEQIMEEMSFAPEGKKEATGMAERRLNWRQR